MTKKPLTPQTITSTKEVANLGEKSDETVGPGVRGTLERPTPCACGTERAGGSRSWGGDTNTTEDQEMDRPTQTTASFVEDRREKAKGLVKQAAGQMKEVLDERVVQNGVRGNAQAILTKLEALTDDFQKLEKAAHEAYGPKAEKEVEVGP